jgi:predicted Zn-dependent peptidase
VQGKINFKRLIAMLERQMAEIEPMEPFVNRRTKPLAYQPSKIVLEKDTHQAHVMVGSRGYDAYDDRRTSLYLLNNILGGPGMNSRLNVALRERRGLVYTVESNLTSYTDTGVFCIYFGSDPEDVDTCLNLVRKELKRLRDNRMTIAQLHAVKKQLIGQICVASDNFENNALGMGKMFLHYNKFEGIERVCQRVEAITADDLLSVANEMFEENYLSTLIYK